MTLEEAMLLSIAKSIGNKEVADLAKERLKALFQLSECSKHALSLGYLGEGSTAGWMKDCLDRLEKTDKEVALCTKSANGQMIFKVYKDEM